VCLFVAGGAALLALSPYAVVAFPAWIELGVAVASAVLVILFVNQSELLPPAIGRGGACASVFWRETLTARPQWASARGRAAPAAAWTPATSLLVH
jgi:hypothetical protein